MFRKVLQQLHVPHVEGGLHSTLHYYMRCMSQLHPRTDQPPTLIPEHVNIRLFNKKPQVNTKQYAKFGQLSKDIYSMVNDRRHTTDDIVKRFHIYLNSSLDSHYASSALLKVLTQRFSKEGDIERCEEISKLFVSLRRTKHPQYVGVYNHYLLSLLNSTDTDRVRQIITELIERQDVSQIHPLHTHNVLRILLKLDMQTECMEILDKQASYSSSGLSSEVVLWITSNLAQVDLAEARSFFEMYQHKIDQDTMICDNYAFLGMVLLELYPPPQDKAIGHFLSYPVPTLRSIHHIPSSGSGVNNDMCRIFHMLLHVASERRIPATFRIIGGRNGLIKHLIHHTQHEYITSIKYIVSLCKAYNVTIDETFWRYLVSSYFYVEHDKRGSLDYKVFLEFYNSLKLYPLTTKLWYKIIIHVYPDQLKLVYTDLIKVGVMDDGIYTVLVDRNSHIEPRYKITDELQSLSQHYEYLQDVAKTQT